MRFQKKKTGAFMVKGPQNSSSKPVAGHSVCLIINTVISQESIFLFTPELHVERCRASYLGHNQIICNISSSLFLSGLRKIQISAQSV